MKSEWNLHKFWENSVNFFQKFKAIHSITTQDINEMRKTSNELLSSNGSFEHKIKLILFIITIEKTIKFDETTENFAHR